MSERKMWTNEEDRIIIHLVRQNEKKPDNAKWKWSEIAQLLLKEVPTSKRTGKQCRERWHNQLDPSIMKDKEWTQEQISALFRLQDLHGNKWALISREIPGRTDNNIKNFFYSSLRRAIRQINQYVSQYKKKSNIKPFKQTILTKILNIGDQKYREKLDIKKNSAVTLANELKNNLAQLSYDHEEKELDEEDKAFRQKIVKQIQEFNKSCKKRKTKKVQEQEEPDLIDEEIDQEINQVHQSEEPLFHHRIRQVKKPEKRREVKNIQQKKPIIEELRKIENEMKKNAGKKQDDVKPDLKVIKKKPQPQIFLNNRQQLDKLVLNKKSSKKVESKQSFQRQVEKKNSVYNVDFVELPEIPRGIMTRRSSMQRDFNFYDPANGWNKKDSIAPLEMFEFGATNNHNPLLGESLNYQDMTDRFGTGLDNKISLNESGFLKLFRQPSRNQ